MSFSDYFDIVRFFGPGAVDPAKVTLKYLDAPFKFGDAKIADYAKTVADRLRSEGRLYNGPMITNVADASFDPPMGCITIQPVDYGDFAGSCFALDSPHPIFDEYGGTLRSYLQQKYPDRSLRDHPLASSLGICGCLMIEEEGKRYLLQVTRSAKLASMAGSWGPSVAGSVDNDTNDRTLADLIERSLGGELEEELSLTIGERRIMPLAWGRERARGEHPQLFCLVTTELAREVLSERFDSMAEHEREFSRYEFVSLDDEGRLSAEWESSLNHEALMNYRLAGEYLSACGWPTL